VRASGLPHRTSSMFTELEGEWDEVFDVVKRATEAVLPYGSRVSLVIKADIRPGRSGELDGKLERLEQTAARFGMFVEYGAYPHLKLEDGGQEIAAVQDWTTLTLVFLRPSYDRKEELLTAISQALA